MIFKGAKGGGTTFKTTPDNLRSEDTFEGILGVGIGPMKGPTRGLKSIKLDGTAIENETGESNFGEGFIALFADGDPAKWPQKVQLKLGGGATPQNVGVSLTNSSAAAGIGTPGPWVTRTLNNTNASFIDIRFIAQQLYRQDKTGIYDETATIEIQMKPVGLTNWVNPILNGTQPAYNETGYDVGDSFYGITRAILAKKFFDSDYGGPSTPYYSITGKTGSPAVYELRIAVPNTDAYADVAWDVRCRLLDRETYDADPDFEKRTIIWESLAAVYPDVMGDVEDWRGFSWLQLYGKASDQLSGIPEVTGEFDTKIVSVPANFNADTRTYTGTWDGSWTKQYTNDPAWVINDAISDSLSGISLVAPGSHLNKWDALELSKWCSVQVPDGHGGFQPRYSLNLAITQVQKAEDFIRYLAGAVGALAYDQGDGEWRVKIDKLDTPIDIFTLENIEGEFSYSGTDIDTRYNDITGQFRNAEMDYRIDAVRLYDNDSIAKIGHKPTTFALVGATDRQEALRRVELRLRASVNEDKIVTFTTNRRGRNVNPLDTILIADGDLGDSEKRTTGRVINLSTDRKTIILRDPVRLESGVSYQIKFAEFNEAYNPDTNIQPTSVDWNKPTIVSTRTINYYTGVTTNVLTVDEPLPENIPEFLVFALEATGLPTLPHLYRVTNVSPEDDKERITISALIIDTEKQDASDNVTNSATVFQDLRGPVPMPFVSAGNDLLSLYATPADQGKNVSLIANWIRPSGAFISGFRVRYRLNGGEWRLATDRTPYTSFDFHNPVPGQYDVEITTLDRRGGISLPLIGSLLVTQELIDATDISYSDGTPIDNLRPWEAGATSGAQIGTNFKDQSGVLVPNDAAVKNSAITISPGGALNGGGGGSVTFSGLGGGNVGLQSDLRLGGSYLKDSAGTTLNDSTVKNSAITLSAGGALNGGGGGSVTFSGLGGGNVGLQSDLRLGGSYLKDSTGTVLNDSTVKNSAITLSAGGALNGAGGGSVTFSGLGGGNVGLQSDLRLGGSYLKDSTGTVLNDSTVKNSAITLSAGGALNGGGGGSVTITGLGYNGDLNATRNRYARSATDPGYTEDGAMWDDVTVSTMPVSKTRYSGTWTISSSYGAKAGTNLFDSANVTLADSAVKNSAITLSAGGALNGGGGGSVTFSGLGGGNVGLQSDLRLGGSYLKDSAGTTLNDSTVKNSAITLSAGGALNGGGGGSVTITGLGYNGDLNATRNRYARAATDPGYTEDGALWDDITVSTMPVAKTRYSGAWNISSSYGAKAGTNLFDSANASLGDSSVKNSAVTLSAGGALNGAGGGSVTFSGLGGGNVGLQSDLRLGGSYLKDSTGTVLNDSTVKNSAVTLSAGGTLNGAGGGSVTANGLGVATNASADINLIQIGGGTYTITGGSATRTDTANVFNGELVSKEIYLDACVVSAIMPNVGTVFGITRNTSSTTNTSANTSHNDADFAFNRNEDGNWYIFESGSSVLAMSTAYNGVTFSASTQFTIQLQGGKVIYLADNVVMRSATGISTGRLSRAFVAGRPQNAGVTNLRFGPGGIRPQSGVTLEDSSGTSLGDSAIKNSAVTLSSGGSLNGAGGGSITMSGLDTASGTGLISRTAKLSSSTGRVSDPTFYNTQAILGPDNTTNLIPTYTVNATNVTVSLPSHTRKITGASGPITLSYGSSSGTIAFSTYWAAYTDDSTLAGNASPTVVFTSDPADLLYPNRYQIASGITPASNGTGGGTTGGGGGGGIVGGGGNIYP